MATTEERMQILKMVADGKITAEEGAKLLAALSSGKREASGAGRVGSEARWFRVRITDIASNRVKVNVNIPMSLVNVGLRMGARFAPTSAVDFQQVMEQVRHGAQGKIVDVTDEDEGERVEIFVE